MLCEEAASVGEMLPQISGGGVPRESEAEAAPTEEANAAPDAVDAALNVLKDMS